MPSLNKISSIKDPIVIFLLENNAKEFKKLLADQLSRFDCSNHKYLDFISKLSIDDISKMSFLLCGVGRQGYSFLVNVTKGRDFVFKLSKPFQSMDERFIELQNKILSRLIEVGVPISDCVRIEKPLVDNEIIEGYSFQIMPYLGNNFQLTIKEEYPYDLRNYNPACLYKAGVCLGLLHGASRKFWEIPVNKRFSLRSKILIESDAQRIRSADKSQIHVKICSIYESIRDSYFPKMNLREKIESDDLINAYLQKIKLEKKTNNDGLCEKILSLLLDRDISRSDFVLGKILLNLKNIETFFADDSIIEFFLAKGQEIIQIHDKLMEMPTLVVHNDANITNFVERNRSKIRSESDVSLIDIEDIGGGKSYQDIVRNFCKLDACNVQYDKEKVKLFLKGYMQNIKLEESEIDYLMYGHLAHFIAFSLSQISESIENIYAIESSRSNIKDYVNKSSDLSYLYDRYSSFNLKGLSCQDAKKNGLNILFSPKVAVRFIQELDSLKNSINLRQIINEIESKKEEALDCKSNFRCKKNLSP